MTRRISLLAAVVLLPASMAVCQPPRQRALEEEGARLICQVEKVARDIHRRTEQLASLNRRSQESQQSHYQHLERIKSLVNDQLQPSLSRLNEIESALPPWQRAAVEQMFALARAMIDATNAAMAAKKEAGSTPTVLNDRYREMVTKMNAYAYILIKTSDAAGDIAAAHRKGEEAGLTVPER
jgi:methyl-accepting chemotaxis protein